MKLFRWKVWRYGRRTTILLVVVATLLLLGGGSYALFVGGGGPATGASSINLSKGLVGWWKMDNNVTDATPNNTVCNSQFFTPSFTNDRKGRANSAFTIGSAKLGFDCGQPLALRVSNVTVSAWVNPSSYNTSGNGIESYGGTVQFYFDSSGFLRFQVHDSTNAPQTFISPSAYAVGSWYFVAATYDGSTVNLYVNGTQVLSTSYTGGIGTNHYADANNDFLLANYSSDSTTKGFIGALDDIRYYNRALSQAEITALYNQYGSGVKAASGENGLVGWWKLQGNAKDATPYGNNGTLNNSPSSVADREGNAGGAYSFNGTNQYISVPNFSGKITGSTAMTISGWVKPPNNPPHSGYFGLRDDTGADFYVLQLNGTNNLECRYRGSNGTASTAGTVSVTPGVWQLVTLVYTGSNVTCYVNGVGGTATTASGSISNANINLDIGAVINTPQHFLNGTVADVRFYKRALSTTEISNLYNSYNSQISLGGDGLNTTTSINLQKGLMGYWPLNGNPNDATPYSDNGAVTSATLTSDRKGRGNSAYSFNGTSAYIDLPITTTYSNLTVSAWFNASSLSGSSPRLVANSHTDVDNKGFELMFRNGGATGFFDVGNGSTNGLAGWTQQLVTGQWYHYVGVYDGSHVIAYLNGTQVATFNYSGGAIAASGFNVDIGRNPAYAGDYFSGTVDDVRIYNRALSAAEVLALYNEYQ